MNLVAHQSGYDDSFGLHTDRVGPAESPLTAVRRRLAGRAPLDPFGLDAHLSDLAAPVLRASMRVHVVGAEHIPTDGPAVLVMNRGFGVFEPTALSVAVMNVTGRRVRVVGAPSVRGIGATLRRFGSIAATPADVTTALQAGHLVIVPLALTWLSAGAGAPPLELMQAVMDSIVVPVAVRPSGPLGTPLSGWNVTVGAPLVPDPAMESGDPLGAAELSESVRAAIDALR